jgi:hypothetical protein
MNGWIDTVNLMAKEMDSHGNGNGNLEESDIENYIKRTIPPWRLLFTNDLQRNVMYYKTLFKKFGYDVPDNKYKEITKNDVDSFPLERMR